MGISTLSLSNDVFEKIKVIDVDTHYSEPYDLWSSRAPAKFKDRVPQVKLLNGEPSWVIDGDKAIGFGAAAASSIRKDGAKCNGLEFMKWRIEDVHPGSYETNARLGVMDETGIWAQIVYGNVLGFGGQNAGKVDQDLRLVSTQIFNDAMAEMQEKSGQRIFPMALLPWWDVTQSVTEIRRCHKMGLRGININSDPQDHGLPDLTDSHWNPLWETCIELNLPINFHIGASDHTVDWCGKQPWPGLPEIAKYVIGSTLMFFGNARVMINIIMSGLLDRFPALKFVSVESGIGWIPFLLEAVEYQLSESGSANRLKLTPTEYFQRNMYACFWFEKRNFVDTVRRVGVDNVLFETDFPHPTCLYPPAASVAQSLLGLTAEEQRKILSENASKVYSIPLK